MIPLSKKKEIASRIWGYAKRKEIKDAYPKKACHMPRHVKKKEKREIAPIQKKEREMVHTKELIHHPPKIYTHLHILIKVYDLSLL